MTQTQYNPPAVTDAPPFGPYETERQARQANGAQVAKGIHGGYVMTPRDVRRLLLIEACEAAGVELGAYDRAILLWLAGWEMSTYQVVIGLVARAHEAGKAAGIADVERAAAIEDRATAQHQGGIVPPGELYFIGETGHPPADDGAPDLQLDLASAIQRIEQVAGMRCSPLREHLIARLAECDAPRLRELLDDEGRALLRLGRCAKCALEVDPHGAWVSCPDGTVTHITCPGDQS